MVIIEDTRQQSGKHEKKHDYFESQDVTLIRSKLPFGDYALAPTVAVDTKASLHEIAVNLCGNAAERQRFIRECKSAKSAGVQLFRAMVMVSERYGCRFEFAPPGKSAARIMDILGADDEERIHQT